MTLILILALVTGAILFGVGVYGALSQTNLVMIICLLYTSPSPRD